MKAHVRVVPSQCAQIFQVLLKEIDSERFREFFILESSEPSSSLKLLFSFLAFPCVNPHARHSIFPRPLLSAFDPTQDRPRCVRTQMLQTRAVSRRSYQALNVRYRLARFRGDRGREINSSDFGVG